MRSAVVAIAVLLGTAAVGMPAGHAQAGPDDGRFTLHRTADGYLRLDRRTGQITSCAGEADDWRCRPVPGGQATALAELSLPAPRESRLQRFGAVVARVWQRVVTMVAEVRHSLMSRA